MASGLAVVTGAASGIGRATSLRLAADGWTLTLVDRAADGLEVTADALRSAYGESSVRDLVVADLSDTGEVESIAADYLKTHEVDLLVNNAGVGFRATAEDTTDEQWDLTFAVNLTAMFRLCRAVIPGMVARGHGVITTPHRPAAWSGLRYRVAYCASKAGVIGLTLRSPPTMRDKGSGSTRSPPARSTPSGSGGCSPTTPTPWATRKLMENRQLDGRLGTPEEVAGGIAFMAGDDGRFFNGSVMVMDAGLRVACSRG